jgi:hypothetical protein
VSRRRSPGEFSSLPVCLVVEKQSVDNVLRVKWKWLLWLLLWVYSNTDIYTTVMVTA